MIFCSFTGLGYTCSDVFTQPSGTAVMPSETKGVRTTGINKGPAHVTLMV